MSKKKEDLFCVRCCAKNPKCLKCGKEFVYEDGYYCIEGVHICINCFDMDKVNDVVGCVPKVDLLEYLREMADYYERLSMDLEGM